MFIVTSDGDLQVIEYPDFWAYNGNDANEIIVSSEYLGDLQVPLNTATGASECADPIMARR